MEKRYQKASSFGWVRGEEEVAALAQSEGRRWEKFPSETRAKKECVMRVVGTSIVEL